MYRKKGTGDYRQLLEGVRLKTLVHGQRLLMGQFRLAKGAEIPSHAHPHEQAGILLSGKVRFTVAEKRFDAEPGDSWCVAGEVPHGAQALEESVVVEVFSPVREDYLP
jgi:quercetin dioxygenase-like cupin family protein